MRACVGGWVGVWDGCGGWGGWCGGCGGCGVCGVCVCGFVSVCVCFVCVCVILFYRNGCFDSLSILSDAGCPKLWVGALHISKQVELSSGPGMLADSRAA